MEAAEVPQGHMVRGNQEAKESHYVMYIAGSVYKWRFYKNSTRQDAQIRSESVAAKLH